MEAFTRTVNDIALVALVLLTMLFALRLWWVLRTRQVRGGLAGVPTSRKWLATAWLVVLPVLCFGLLAQLFVLQRGSVFMSDQAKFTLALMLTTYIAFELAMRLRPRMQAGRAVLLGSVAGVLVLACVAILLALRYAGAVAYPPPSESALLGVPFDGEWAAIGAGATALTNHHHRIASQRYAMDLAKSCNDGRLYRGAGQSNAESCTFGARVLSPVDGIVSHAVDGLPDSRSKRELAGNHVVIGFGQDRYVALAHLRQGSVRVKVGDRVRVGDDIGRAGNSGNSDFPHLHVHVQDTPVYDLRHSRSIPFRFRSMERKRFLGWMQVERGFLLSNDRVRTADPD